MRSLWEMGGLWCRAYMEVLCCFRVLQVYIKISRRFLRYFHSSGIWFWPPLFKCLDDTTGVNGRRDFRHLPNNPVAADRKGFKWWWFVFLRTEERNIDEFVLWDIRCLLINCYHIFVFLACSSDSFVEDAINLAITAGKDRRNILYTLVKHIILCTLILIVAN